MTYYPIHQSFYEKINHPTYVIALPQTDASDIRWQSHQHPHINSPSAVPIYAGSPMSYQWCYTSESPVFTHPCSYYVDLNTSQEIFLPNNSYPPTFTPVQYPDISPINSVSKKLLYNDYSTSEINHQKKRDDATSVGRDVLRWRPKYTLSRTNSNDSGIAESPFSMMSSMTSRSFDDSSLDSDECKSLEKLHISESHDQIDQSENSEMHSLMDSKLAEEEKFWSIEDDKKFWQRLRHQPPNNHIVNVIAEQVEYYMSDDYLLKDKYLLRQIRCKKDGYVSIKLITSFKKVKKLTKDWAVVRSAIVRRSKKILVSSEGLRIRRKTQLSETLLKPRLLTSVLVIRLPEEYNTVNRMTSLFSGFGEISFVRLLRTDKSVPTDLKNYATQVPDIGRSLCAVVDFESPDDALTSVRVLKFFQRHLHSNYYDIAADEENVKVIQKYEALLKGLPNLGDMRLALLGPRVRRTLYRQDRIHDDFEDEDPKMESIKSILSPDFLNLSATNFEERKNPSVLKLTKPKYLVRKMKILSNISQSNSVYAIRQPRGPVDGKNFVGRTK